MSLHLLLIDDSPGDARLVEEAARTCPDPCELTFATTPDEGIELARSDRPDLVLLDLNLPGKGGVEVLAELRASAWARTLPVVIFTTSASPRTCQELYTLGANSVVIKPESWDAFVEKVHTIVRFWGQVAHLPSPALGAQPGEAPH